MKPSTRLLIIYLVIILVTTITGASTNGLDSKPIPDFSADVINGPAPLAVSFTDHSLNSPSGWAWYFGDETYSALWAHVTAHAGWTARRAQSSVVMPDGSIVLMGGLDSSGLRNDVWRSTNGGVTWTLMTADAGWSPREGQTNVVMPDGSIVLMGGGDGRSPPDFNNDVWRSTDYGGTWTQMTAHAGWTARVWHSSVVMPDGSIVLMSGSDGWFSFTNDVWRSTDSGATWTRMTEHAGWSERGGQNSVVMPDGSIILMGGYDGSHRNDVWRSTDRGATWTLMTVSAGWSGRGGPSSVTMPDGSILLMGGGVDGGAITNNDVWRSTNNGATWTLVNSHAGWPARIAPSSVVMPDGSVLIMGGGRDGDTSNVNDVWMLMPVGSSAQNPSHTYTSPGTYQVALQSYNDGGFNSILKAEYITVGSSIPEFPSMVVPVMVLVGCISVVFFLAKRE